MAARTAVRRAGRAAEATAPRAETVVNAGLPSAAANSAALANRSAGSFSSAFATAAATFGGTDLRSSVTGRAPSVMIFMMICCAEPPSVRRAAR